MQKVYGIWYNEGQFRRLMGKRWHKVVIGIVGAVILVAVVVLVKIALTPEVEDVESESAGVNQEETYGFVEPETVATLVAKFNIEIMDQTGWELLPADDTTMMTYENNYWYPLDDDIALVVVPVEFSGDKAQDTVLTMLIYVDKDSVNQEKARSYWQYLVQANSEDYSAEEVTELMAEAEMLRERGEMANRGKGLFVAINEVEGGDHIEYQVVRNYRED